MERRYASEGAARDLSAFLRETTPGVDPPSRAALQSIVDAHTGTVMHVEKAVDVMLAVDLVVLADRDEYDTAYVLSADGDYTPAAKHVRSRGKRVFAVSASSGAQLAAVVDKFIRLKPDWALDCYI